MFGLALAFGIGLHEVGLRLGLRLGLGLGAGIVRIFVVQERLNRIFGYGTIWPGGLRGYETVSTGSFVACAVRD